MRTEQKAAKDATDDDVRTELKDAKDDDFSGPGPSIVGIKKIIL